MPARPANLRRWAAGLAALLCCGCAPVLADSPAVDKVYAPYVQALEREVEFRSIVQQDDNPALDGSQIHRLALGWAWSDRWATELYLVGEKTSNESLSLEALEVEAQWQLTDQGEYWADWGVPFELEQERNVDIWEYKTRLLVAREWGRWVTTANLGLIYERGDDIRNEWETVVALQGRYRLSPRFEPALELYTGEDTKGLGPVFLGEWRTGTRSRLRWQLGVILGLDDESSDQTWRALLEYEC